VADPIGKVAAPVEHANPPPPPLHELLRPTFGTTVVPQPAGAMRTLTLTSELLTLNATSLIGPNVAVLIPDVLTL
jgi:hypothetical protein